MKLCLSCSRLYQSDVCPECGSEDWEIMNFPFYDGLGRYEDKEEIMPVHVVKRSGDRPYKIVEKSGKVVGSSTNRKDAEISASKRNKGK